MIYLDGSALCRFLPGVRHGEVWQNWVASHPGELVTSRLGLTELRQAAALYPRDAIDEISAVLERVRTEVPVIRFSDDNVSISSHANAVLKPFAALHIGAAAGDDRVDSIATYDPSLAHVAEIYRLKVVTPGLDERWYLEFEGPVDTWSPIELDAPQTPGSEVVLNPKDRPPDPFEVALQEVSAIGERAPTADTPIDLEEIGQERLSQEDPDDAEFLREMRAAEVQALARMEIPSDSTDDKIDESEEDEDLAEGIDIGGITASVNETDDEESSLVEEAEPKPEVVVTLPPSSSESLPPSPPPTPAPPPPPTPAPPPPPPPPTAESESDASRRRAEMIARLGVYQPKVEAWEGPGSLGERPSTVETPEPEVPESSVGPVGEPVRRPFLERSPDTKEVASVSMPEEVEEDGIPAPQMPPMIVKFEEPISYAPARYDPSGARPLPGAHPFARAGQTAAMEAPPIPPQDVPSLEPLLNPQPPPVARPIVRDFPVMEAEPEEASEKASRRRRGKEDKEEKKRRKEPPPSPPSPPSDEEEAGWRLEDIIGHGSDKGKRKPT